MSSPGKLSIVRVYALIFGVAYVGLAALEDFLGSSGLHSGTHIIFKLTPVQNSIHWVVGIAVLGSFFAGDAIAKLVARAVGLVFVLVTASGFVARNFTGKLLGFHAKLPWSYNLIHLATAAAALFAGFVAEGVYKQRGS